MRLPGFLLISCIALFAITIDARSLKQKNQPEYLYQVSRHVTIDGENRMQFGFIDKTGKMVIEFCKLPSNTWYVGEFHDGLAVIYLVEDRAFDKPQIGYIDTRGELAVKPTYSYARDFSEGLAYVENKEFRGYIDPKGKAIIRVDGLAGAFSLTSGENISGKDFHEGLAAVGTGSWRGYLLGREESSMYGVWGYIDRSGKMVVKPIYRFADNFSEGRAGVVVDHKYGFIDNKGTMIVPPRFDPKRGGPHGFGIAGTSQFHDGLALVKEDLYAPYGYIDRDGKYAVPPRFTMARDFSEGVAWVTEHDSATHQLKEVGWIDKTGNWVLALKQKGFDEWGGEKFTDGLAAIRLPKDEHGEELYAYIDHQGHEAIKPAFNGAEAFVGGVARVTIHNAPVFIDRTGRIIWKPR